jgi:putative FmdB family regulatory protein
MPVYEYECRDCDRRFDALTTMAQADEASCPHCSSANARRLLSVIGGLTGMASGSASASTSEGAPACGGGACAHCS